MIELVKYDKTWTIYLDMKIDKLKSNWIMINMRARGWVGCGNSVSLLTSIPVYIIVSVANINWPTGNKYPQRRVSHWIVAASIVSWRLNKLVVMSFVWVWSDKVTTFRKNSRVVIIFIKNIRIDHVLELTFLTFLWRKSWEHMKRKRSPTNSTAVPDALLQNCSKGHFRERTYVRGTHRVQSSVGWYQMVRSHGERYR